MARNQIARGGQGRDICGCNVERVFELTQLSLTGHQKQCTNYQQYEETHRLFHTDRCLLLLAVIRSSNHEDPTKGHVVRVGNG